MTKFVLLIILAFSVQGCNYDLTGETPWIGHTYNKHENKQEFWFTRYETNSWCLSQTKLELEKTGKYTNSWLGYSKPYNCAFDSNNFLESVYHYYFTVDRNYYQCIWMTYDPSRIKDNTRYSYLLKGHAYRAGRCIW